jgi:hypothetical protein
MKVPFLLDKECYEPWPSLTPSCHALALCYAEYIERSDNICVSLFISFFLNSSMAKGCHILKPEYRIHLQLLSLSNSPVWRSTRSFTRNNGSMPTAPFLEESMNRSSVRCLSGFYINLVVSNNYCRDFKLWLRYSKNLTLVCDYALPWRNK